MPADPQSNPDARPAGSNPKSGGSDVPDACRISVVNLSRWSIPLAVAWLSAAVGCNGDVSPQARLLLAGGKEELRKGNHARALQDLDAFLREASGSRLAGEGYYYRGRAKLAGGDRAGAREDFTLAAGTLTDKSLAAEAMLALGRLTEESGDLPSAERLYRQCLEKLELGQRPGDEALLCLGMVLQKQGRWAEADAPLDRLIHVFAGSPRAEEAGRRVRCTAWTIRAALLPARPVAAEAADALARAGLPAAVREVIEGGRLAFSVEVGRYSVYAQAYAALGEVRAHAAKAEIVETR